MRDFDHVYLTPAEQLAQSHLPIARRDDHAYAFFIHDATLAAWRHALANGLPSVTVPLINAAEQETVNALTSEPLANWLKQHRPAAWTEMVQRQMFAALAGDALHFLCESLRCSEKGKLTVAFALLRKPFRDNLIFLELLLGDPDRFTRVIADPRNEQRTVEYLTQDNRGKAIIAGAVKQLKHPAFDADFVWDLRYGKQAHYSLDPLWSKAIHLVTSHKSYATESHNMNFIFSSEENIESQWSGYYGLVPVLLFHFSEVVISLLRRFSTAELQLPFDIEFRRTFGFILWASRNHRRVAGFPDLAAFNLACPNCDAPVLATEASMWKAYTDLRVECAECRLGIRVGRGGFEPAFGALIQAKRRELRQSVLRVRRKRRH